MGYLLGEEKYFSSTNVIYSREIYTEKDQQTVLVHRAEEKIIYNISIINNLHTPVNFSFSNADYKLNYHDLPFPVS